MQALTLRGRSPNQRGENRGKSKLRLRFGNCSLTRDQCEFCKQNEYWKKDCPKLNKKNKLKEKSVKPSEVNIAKSNRNKSDSSTFSLSIMPFICYSDASEWLLYTGLPITYVPGKNSFLA